MKYCHIELIYNQSTKAISVLSFVWEDKSIVPSEIGHKSFVTKALYYGMIVVFSFHKRKDASIFANQQIVVISLIYIIEKLRTAFYLLLGECWGWSSLI
jgi:hypothetical protein